MVSIIAKDKEYLVINKPAGLLVHPARTSREKTLADFLREQYPETAGVGDDPDIRPGIVHRLDREASGLLVVARTQKMFEWLKKQFQDRVVIKEYTALVYGRIVKDEDVIQLPLSRNYKKTIVKPMSQTEEGEEALTHFVVTERFQHYTLLQISIKTGRTHQIRAHLAHYNHSIVGDQKYLHPRFRNRTAFTKYVKSDRVFLHAGLLGFYCLPEEEAALSYEKAYFREYRAELPSDLNSFLQSLKK